MGEREHPQQQPVEEMPDKKDVDMDPEEHVSRPRQPDFDPAEREQFEDPDATLPTEDDA
jgi:hypothetical protein